MNYVCTFFPTQTYVSSMFLALFGPENFHFWYSVYVHFTMRHVFLQISYQWRLIKDNFICMTWIISFECITQLKPYFLFLVYIIIIVIITIIIIIIITGDQCVDQLPDIFLSWEKVQESPPQISHPLHMVSKVLYFLFKYVNFKNHHPPHMVEYINSKKTSTDGQPNNMFC